ncbi:ABC transporter permease subunit [Mesobacillus subterraneus]|uniref:nickel transporter permease n=1 Tax=Mesobacillus subterraneus TaxID=285983 RepID=UPI001CFDB29E|nr:nickel transporter permease [Mesobacillus subterraneus]WLR57778.1 ABC transporter permease subunit [Mesobacillus subterraneus]
MVALIGVLFILVLGAPFIAPHDPTEVQLSERLKPMSSEYLFGTDHMGRDIVSRILVGAQTTVGTSMLVLILALGIGLPIGLLSGYIGGALDRFFMRIVDAFLAFPDFIIAIVLSGLLGPGMVNLVVALVTVKWVNYARLVRSTVLSEKQKEYISVAKINGLSSFTILRKHIIPHVVGNLVVYASLDLGKVILVIASLSYIGLGAQPPTPEWGAMLNEGSNFFHNAPQLMYIPGLAIMLVVLILNLLGDSLRDLLDVKSK